MAVGSSGRKRGRKANSALMRIMIFLFCIALISMGKADITAMSSIRTVLVGLVVPVADIVSVPIRAAAGMVEGMQTVANLRQENARLREDIKRLNQLRLKAEALQAENRQLKSVSGVVVPEAMRAVSARVIAINADSFAHSVMVNTGADKGLKKGNPVITTDGLVGMVVDVGLRHAQVLLITDINAMIPVILSSSSWPGTTVGRNSKSLDLRFLPTEATMAIDELVQTSGHGGVMPPGIPVGRVASIGENEARIEPLVDLQRLSFVTILVTDHDPGFSADNLFDQAYNPLPPEDDGFTLQGLTILGQRLETDITNKNERN